MKYPEKISLRINEYSEKNRHFWGSEGTARRGNFEAKTLLKNAP